MPTGRPDLKDASLASADVRSSRFYLLSRGHLAALLRRSLSVLALVTLDVLGLALGIYVALVLRSVAYGRPVYWSLLWREGPQDWLKFLAPVMILVFWQAGLYTARERRAGVGSIVSSLVVLAIIVLAFGFGTSYDFTTTGLIPTAVVTSALTIGLLRAAYGSFSLEVMTRRQKLPPSMLETGDEPFTSTYATTHVSRNPAFGTERRASATAPAKGAHWTRRAL